MKVVLRNILAVVVGVIFGSIVNMGFVILGAKLIPGPAGADLMSMEGLKAAMPLMQPQNFIFPFIAHALGTFAGAAAAARLGASRHLMLAMGIGLVFLYGGYTTIRDLPSPVWFSVLDLVGAYLPMAWLGYKLAAARMKQLAGDAS